MNTTTLIAEWSMEGARRDVGGRFRRTDDIRALLGGEPDETEAPLETPATGGSVLVKRAGEEDWRPLTLDAE